MKLALITGVALVLLYAISYIVLTGNECNCWLRLLSFVAPIVSGAVTLIGVGLTIHSQGEYNDKMLKRNEELNLLIQRQEHMPIVECCVDSRCEKDCETNTIEDSGSTPESGQPKKHYASLQVRGKNPVCHAELMLYSANEQLNSKQSLVESGWLTEKDGVVQQELCLENLFDQLFLHEAHCVLTYRDVLGNCYWRYCRLMISYEDEDNPLFEEAFLGLDRQGKTYCEAVVSEETLKQYLISEQELAHRADAEEMRYLTQLDIWKEQLPEFEEISQKAHEVAWADTRDVPECFRKCFRDKLSGGGFGGGQIIELKRSKNGRYLYPSWGYGVGFFSSESEYNRIEITWSITVEYDLSSKMPPRVIKRTLCGVDPNQSFALRLKMRRQINPVSFAVLHVVSLVRYAMAERL